MRPSDLIRDLAQLGASYRGRYGTSIFDIRTRVTGRDVVVAGEVLLPSQRAALSRVAHRHPELRCRYEIDVITETPKTVLAVADDAVVDVHESARPNAKLATQVTGDDPPFEILAERYGRYLVRLDDDALGWIDEKRARVVSRRPIPRVIVAGDAHDVVHEGLSYLGVLYLTGGCTRAAIDCSALIQRVFRSVLGRVLPRNTRDQMRRGLPIALARARPGDVAFLRGSLGVHTGMFLRDGRLLHASYRRHRIAIDTLADLRQSLRLVTIRRFAETR